VNIHTINSIVFIGAKNRDQRLILMENSLSVQKLYRFSILLKKALWS